MRCAFGDLARLTRFKWTRRSDVAHWSAPWYFHTVSMCFFVGSCVLVDIFTHTNGDSVVGVLLFEIHVFGIWVFTICCCKGISKCCWGFHKDQWGSTILYYLIFTRCFSKNRVSIICVLIFCVKHWAMSVLWILLIICLTKVQSF